MKTIGLALGGGGVRGLAHVLILEALDEMGLKPAIIAGTSMGAIVGALYASGLSGREIKEQIRDHIVSPGDSWRLALKKQSDVLKWMGALALEHGRGGIVKADRFLNRLLSQVHKATFADLGIPLKVIASDYWRAEEVVLRTGKLRPALQATMALPGIFAPISLGRRVLLDGGVTNLVPYEHVLDDCDLSIAVNVAPYRNPATRRIPTVFESISGAIDIMQAATWKEKLRRRQPSLSVWPEIRGVPLLDFGKTEQVFRQARPAVQAMKRSLAEIMEATL